MLTNEDYKFLFDMIANNPIFISDEERKKIEEEEFRKKKIEWAQNHPNSQKAKEILLKEVLL